MQSIRQFAKTKETIYKNHTCFLFLLQETKPFSYCSMDFLTFFYAVFIFQIRPNLEAILELFI